jgi:hypothetical protein
MHHSHIPENLTKRLWPAAAAKQQSGVALVPFLFCNVVCKLTRRVELLLANGAAWHHDAFAALATEGGDYLVTSRCTIAANQLE